MSVDYLTEDSLVPEGQHFLCISFLRDPECKKTLTGVKVRGVFNELDEAHDFAKKLQSVDPLHNIFVGEVGKWLAYDPDPNSKEAGSPEYANEELNKIMKAHLESNEKSKLFHEHHKNKQARENIEASIKTSKETKKGLMDELAIESNDKKITSLNDKLKILDEQIDSLEKKRKEYKTQEKLSSEQMETIGKEPVESTEV